MKRLVIVGALSGAALISTAGVTADAIVNSNVNVNIHANSNAYVHVNNSQFLDGSSDALVLGPTGIPTPSAGFISQAVDLYLDPLGYDGTTASSIAFTIPNQLNFFQSVPQGTDDLVAEILARYEADDMGCDDSGICSDPLTITTYSQSSLVAALAEERLADAGVPTDALRFVMLGANPDVVANDLYPTEIFNIDGDVFADHVGQGLLGLLFGSVGFQDVLFGLGLHSAYMGLTADQIGSATETVDGLTTINEIPTLTTSELFSALFTAFLTAA